MAINIIMLNQIIHGDCFEVLKDIPDKSIDAVITDPPYLTTNLQFDKSSYDVDSLLGLLLLKLKDTGQIATFGSVELLAKFSSVFTTRWTGVWLKPNHGFRSYNAKKPPSKMEIYGVFAHPKHTVDKLTFNKIIKKGEPYQKKNPGIKRSSWGSQLTMGNPNGFTEINLGTRHQTDVIEAPNKPCMKIPERSKHPTQKPIKVISTLIQWITIPSDLVLDPFCGSGTTAVACKELGRNYICIEKEKEYFDIACDRIFQPREYSETELEIMELKQPEFKQLSLLDLV
jgi:site-specific DNA-methyltransferase (adenine-specific)